MLSRVNLIKLISVDFGDEHLSFNKEAGAAAALASVAVGAAELIIDQPEIIIKANYFSEKINLAKPWYHGTNPDSESIREWIALIDKSLE